MKIAKLRTSALALLWSLTLITSAAVPEADAGVWSFLKRHFHHQKAGEESSPTVQQEPAKDASTGTGRTINDSSAQKSQDVTAPTAGTASYTGHHTATNGHKFTTRASWYGHKFQGKRTASGQPFNEQEMTAASRTLPLGSKLHVSNPATGKSCTVTINDRGPFVKGRGIDLSHGAAKKIGLTGVAPVVCEKCIEAPTETVTPVSSTTYGK